MIKARVTVTFFSQSDLVTPDKVLYRWNILCNGSNVFCLTTCVFVRVRVWRGERYFAIVYCLTTCVYSDDVHFYKNTQADLSHSESVFFIPAETDCSTFNFGVFLLALGWGYSVVKARTERKEGNYALTLGSRGIRSWDWRRRRFWGFHISRPSHTGSSSALQVKKDAFGRPYAPTCKNNWASET